MSEWDRILSLLDKSYTLHYVDYQSNLDDHPELLQTAIQGNTDKLYETIDTWFMDDFSGMDYAIDNVIADIRKEFDLAEEDAQNLYYKYEDKIKDIIYERDDSNPFKDLLRNTKKFAIFYDLEFPITGYPCDSDVSVKEVKRALKIKIKDTRFDKEIKQMVLNASYGGLLVVYFNSSIEELLNVEARTVIFENPVLAIIDTCNGSGGDCTIPNLTLSFPFNPKNLYICKSIKYGYTHSVCGMSDDWCSNTTFYFKGTPLKIKKPQTKTDLQIHIEQEERYNNTFKQGKCTHGDMDINRHRRTIYENGMPCGIRCVDCGNFWID